jgi:hypothetical protein
VEGTLPGFAGFDTGLLNTGSYMSGLFSIENLLKHLA